MNIAGVILAGGKSSRFGKTKDSKITAEIREKSFLEYTIERLQQVSDEIYIIIASKDQHDIIAPYAKKYSKVKFLMDGENLEYEFLVNQGPLTGICTALVNITSSRIIFSNIDTPLLPKHLDQALLEIIENEPIAYLQRRSSPMFLNFAINGELFEIDYLFNYLKVKSKGELKLRPSDLFFSSSTFVILKVQMLEQHIWQLTNINTQEILKEVDEKSYAFEVENDTNIKITPIVIDLPELLTNNITHFHERLQLIHDRLSFSPVLTKHIRADILKRE